MRFRVTAWILIIAQTGWLAYLLWLLAVNSRCGRGDCSLNDIAYLFWGGVEVLMLPFVVGAIILLRR